MICVPDGRIGLSGTTYFLLPARTEVVDSAVLHHLFPLLTSWPLSRLGHHMVIMRYPRHARLVSALVLDVLLV